MDRCVVKWMNEIVGRLNEWKKEDQTKKQALSQNSHHQNVNPATVCNFEARTILVQLALHLNISFRIRQRKIIEF